MMSSSKHPRHSHTFRLPLALAVGLALGTPGAYADNSASPVSSRTVSYVDLDLNTSAGTVQLYRRIRSAAMDVCTLPDNASLSGKGLRQSCEAHAIDSAVAKIGNRNLTAYHRMQRAGDSASADWSLGANNIAPR